MTEPPIKMDDSVSPNIPAKGANLANPELQFKNSSLEDIIYPQSLAEMLFIAG